MRHTYAKSERGEGAAARRLFEIYRAAVSFHSAVDHFSLRRFEGLSPFAFPPPLLLNLYPSLNNFRQGTLTHSPLACLEEIGAS